MLKISLKWIKSRQIHLKTTKIKRAILNVLINNTSIDELYDKFGELDIENIKSELKLIEEKKILSDGDLYKYAEILAQRLQYS